jgi:hypothetical protein
MNKEKKQSCERCGSWDGIDIYFGSTQRKSGYAELVENNCFWVDSSSC